MDLPKNIIETLLLSVPFPGYEVWEIGFEGCWSIDKKYIEKQSRYQQKSAGLAKVRNRD